MTKWERARSSSSLLLACALVAGTAHGAKRDERPAPTFIALLGRILELEDTRQGGPELDRLLHHREPGIKRRAALAAGRIGDPRLVPTIVGLMNDPEPAVREMAAFALGLVGDPQAVDRLVASLEDSDPRVRARAAEALGRLGDARAAPAVARFVIASAPDAEGAITVHGDDPAAPDDPWIEARLGLVALAGLGDEEAARTALLAGGGLPRFDWWVSTWVATRLEKRSLRPVLLAAARSQDARSRALAARGLGAPGDEAALDVLEALAGDEDEIVAFEALRALAKVGGEKARGVVQRGLDSRSDIVRRQALVALAALPPERRLRTRIVPFVGDPSAWIRAAALGALARTDREDFALVLSGMDPDEAWSVRAALATALGELGGEMSVGILHSMLEDPDVRVLPAVLGALHAARGADAVETLRRHLGRADMGVRAAAGAELARVRDPSLVPALLDAWRRGTADGELEPRLSALDALIAQGEAAETAVAEVAREDRSRAVRVRAARALAASGAGAVPDPGPEDVARPAVDYRAAMAPLYPAVASVLYTPRAFVRTRHGTFEIHLDVLEAPLTTAAFVRLAERGFYDGLDFHRVEPGFVVQGGCPRGDGYGGPGYALRDEITRRPFGRGAVGLALAGPDTGGSQFFVTLGPQPHLDGRYPRFGVVVAGMDVVERIRPGDRIERVEVWKGPALAPPPEPALAVPAAPAP